MTPAFVRAEHGFGIQYGDMQEFVPLAPRTTLGVGGSARRFLEVASEAALLESLRLARSEGWPVFLLGGGSNLVLHDDGWPGLVLSLAGKTIAETEAPGTLTVDAGVSWDDFVRFSVERGLGGIECLAGIPGTVGATPVQNVGAYGQDVSETLVSARALDASTLEISEIPASACGFGYRKSRFNSGEPGRWLILSVTFALKPGAPPVLKYADLQKHFGEGASPSLPEVYRAVREIRGRKGMVVDPADPDSRSAGSFFKNPVIGQQRKPTDSPGWPVAGTDDIKLPAAWLIEKAGLKKGTPLVGAVSISGKHPLALVNRGGATARDVAESAKLVQARVLDAWGIGIHPEPLFVGPWTEETLPEGATAILP